MRNIQKLIDAHKTSSHNKDLVKRSKICACFHCRTWFSSKEVNRWIPGEETAICPRCGIDSVIPDASGIQQDRDFVAEMHRYWFG
ncbi:MAG: cytoplasmic protein [Candidatus Coprovivens sp.]